MNNSHKLTIISKDTSVYLREYSKLNYSYSNICLGENHHYMSFYFFVFKFSCLEIMESRFKDKYYAIKYPCAIMYLRFNKKNL